MIGEEDVDLRNNYVSESLKLQLTQESNAVEETSASKPDFAHQGNHLLKESSFPDESDQTFSTVFCGNLAHTLEFVKNWSVWSYNRTRKKLNETIGNANIPIDVELEESMEALTDVQARYAQLLKIVISNITALQSFVQSQENFNQGLLELMQQDDCSLKNSAQRIVDDQATLTRLLPFYCTALNYFVQSLRTLCETTFEDTIATIQRYESARSEFDFHQTLLDALIEHPDENSAKSREAKISGQRIEVEKARKMYEDLRKDVQTKMTLLHQNKIKVMHKNLECYCSATSAFYAGDAESLQATLTKFNLTSQLLQLKEEILA